MRFLVDAQLPPALARILSAKGFEAEHVFDVALGAADDSAVWQHATATQAVIITKDEDFASMVNLHNWASHRMGSHRQYE
jgi:predicted nuclease of predicted toxin-antitoxin system